MKGEFIYLIDARVTIEVVAGPDCEGGVEVRDIGDVEMRLDKEWFDISGLKDGRGKRLKDILIEEVEDLLLKKVLERQKAEQF